MGFIKVRQSKSSVRKDSMGSVVYTDTIITPWFRWIVEVTRVRGGYEVRWQKQSEDDEILDHYVKVFKRRDDSIRYAKSLIRYKQQELERRGFDWE